MMFARGVLASSPNFPSASTRRCAGVSVSGKAARTREAREISALSTTTPLGPRNRLITGRKACVASAGASSVRVYQILADFFMPVAASVGASAALSSISTGRLRGGRETRDARGKSGVKDSGRGDRSGPGASRADGCATDRRSC